MLFKTVLSLFVGYWEQRYSRTNKSYDWYFDNHEKISAILNSFGTKNLDILNVGCGNSSVHIFSSAS